MSSFSSSVTLSTKKKKLKKAKLKASGTETSLNFCCTLQIAPFVMCLIWKSSGAVFGLSALVEEGSHRGVPEASLWLTQREGATSGEGTVGM